MRNDIDAFAAGTEGRSAPKCQICSSIVIDNDPDRAHIEKSTKLILGLMSHYSETLLGAIKRGPAPKTEKLRKTDSEDSDGEEYHHNKVHYTRCCVWTVIVLSVLLAGAVGLAVKANFLS